MKLDGSRSRARRMKTILISHRGVKRSWLNFVLLLPLLTSKLSNDRDFRALPLVKRIQRDPKVSLSAL